MTTLGFFTELDEGELASLFSNEVIASLQAMNAGVAMGLRDLGEVRASVVQRLNAANIPLTAWLLLPRAQGYFATFDNSEHVRARWHQTLEWIRKNNLKFVTVGLDFERDLRELERFFSAQTTTTAKWLAQAPRANAIVDAARERAHALVRQIHSDGFAVESYHVPLVLDDRVAGGSMWQRVTGSVDLHGVHQVMMLYTSLLGPFGLGLLDSYAPECSAIGVGSTGGGIDPLPKLTWAQLERDVRIAASHCDDVRVFSLEGCVRNDLLTRLVGVRWQSPVAVPTSQRLGATAWRMTARATSWLLSG